MMRHMNIVRRLVAEKKKTRNMLMVQYLHKVILWYNNDAIKILCMMLRDMVTLSQKYTSIWLNMMMLWDEDCVIWKWYISSIFYNVVIGQKNDAGPAGPKHLASSVTGACHAKPFVLIWGLWSLCSGGLNQSVATNKKLKGENLKRRKWLINTDSVTCQCHKCCL